MRKNVLLYTVALIFTCLTSLTHIAGKEAVSTLSPWVVGFGRFMIGAIVMWVIMVLEHQDQGWAVLAMWILYLLNAAYGWWKWRKAAFAN